MGSNLANPKQPVDSGLNGHETPMGNHATIPPHKCKWQWVWKDGVWTNKIRCITCGRTKINIGHDNFEIIEDEHEN